MSEHKPGREGLIEKIRALLNKTTASNCTEEEELAALDKARALMDAYEVTEEELKLTKEDSAILRSEPEGSTDPHNIKFYLARAVAEFCSCRAWRKPGVGIQFCGLPSDVRQGTWLLDHLQAFVQRQLVEHLIGNLAPNRLERRRVINGFVAGICERINERLEALCKQSEVAATPNKNALIVVKDAAIDAKMKAEGIRVRSCSSSRVQNASARNAGRAAGDRASFGRPVSGAGAVPRLR